jgi:hypothetical protein
MNQMAIKIYQHLLQNLPNLGYWFENIASGNLGDAAFQTKLSPNAFVDKKCRKMFLTQKIKCRKRKLLHLTKVFYLSSFFVLSNVRPENAVVMANKSIHKDCESLMFRTEKKYR